MKPPLWTSLALIAGLSLMLFGPLAVSLFLPTQAVWTNADAQKLTQASANLHATIHAHGAHSHSHDNGQVAHGPSDHHDEHSAKPRADLAAAQKEYETQQARLDASLSRPIWLGHGLRILGVLLAAAGVGGYLMASRSGR